MSEFLHEGGIKLRQKVRAIILNDKGEFLLVRPHGYHEDEWTLAGGGVEQGETAQQAMRREIAEELGIVLEEDLEQLPVGNRFIYSAEHKAKRALDHDGQEAAMFVVRLPCKIPLSLQAEEIAEARWFTRNQAVAAFPVEKQRQVFEACLAAIAA